MEKITQEVQHAAAGTEQAAKLMELEKRKDKKEQTLSTDTYSGQKVQTDVKYSPTTA